MIKQINMHLNHWPVKTATVSHIKNMTPFLYCVKQNYTHTHTHTNRTVSYAIPNCVSFFNLKFSGPLKSWD